MMEHISYRGSNCHICNLLIMSQCLTIQIKNLTGGPVTVCLGIWTQDPGVLGAAST